MNLIYLFYNKHNPQWCSSVCSSLLSYSTTSNYALNALQMMTRELVNCLFSIHTNIHLTAIVGFNSISFTHTFLAIYKLTIHSFTHSKVAEIHIFLISWAPWMVFEHVFPELGDYHNFLSIIRTANIILRLG